MSNSRPVPEKILREVIEYDGTDARRIHHLLKVTGFVDAIAEAEIPDEETRYMLHVTAILHDIGIHEAKRIYGTSAGPYQEKTGAEIARQILQRHEMPEKIMERICWLIAHHHTFKPIEGIDHQILLEADFLVNAYEKNMPRSVIETFYEKIAATATGKKMLTDIFLS